MTHGTQQDRPTRLREIAQLVRILAAATVPTEATEEAAADLELWADEMELQEAGR